MQLLIFITVCEYVFHFLLNNRKTQDILITTHTVEQNDILIFGYFISIVVLVVRFILSVLVCIVDKK